MPLIKSLVQADEDASSCLRTRKGGPKRLQERILGTTNNQPRGLVALFPRPRAAERSLLQFHAKRSNPRIHAWRKLGIRILQHLTASFLQIFERGGYLCDRRIRILCERKWRWKLTALRRLRDDFANSYRIKMKVAQQPVAISDQRQFGSMRYQPSHKLERRNLSGRICIGFSGRLLLSCRTAALGYLALVACQDRRPFTGIDEKNRRRIRLKCTDDSIRKQLMVSGRYPHSETSTQCSQQASD